ncbi:transcription-repair coupling factor [Inconstantimicrobium mannanitabidum]|uniref:Transcription-repair-coupling factor n=1 Tax=Inconstantimicrobium mannanitabidum TaxID=1604901 RepID=A0ACB5RI31_9CLOT|nr:transcription-repair coupling factor [Clostridium sp. TW13]GKX68723.1 transcription-repair-coupling factor [Clostridium sp. TW13]
MRLDGIMIPLLESKEFMQIQSMIKERKFPIGINGLSESGKSYFVSALFGSSEKSIVVVTHSDYEARNIYEDLSLYINEVYYFPSKEVVFYNIDAISGDLRWARLKILKEIIESKRKKIIVTSVENFSANYTPLDLIKEHSFTIKVGETVDFNEITTKLVQAGYTRMEVVDGKGQFSLRGGILDLYPPTATIPYRIELFDDEVDSIRTFNVESQRSIEKVSCCEVFPAKEVVLKEENINRGIELMTEQLSQFVSGRGKEERDVVDRITSTVNANIESLRETWNFETIESYLTFFFEKPSNFFEFTKDFLFVMDEVERCKGKVESVNFEFQENYSAFLSRGNILPEQGNLLLGLDQIKEYFNEQNIVSMNTFTDRNDFINLLESIPINQTISHDYHGQLDLLIDDIRLKKQQGYRIIILSGTRPRGERLVETLRDREIESRYADTISDIQCGEVVITFGNQLKGFEYPDLKLCIISDKEVFGEAKRKLSRGKASKRKGVAKITTFAELKPGDYVVHANNGIGVYKGIKQIETNGNKRDYLDIEYAKGDKLYVPVDQLDLVQKYIGGEGTHPKVNKLGTAEWQKAKAKVKKSINEIAEELVKLYAIRNTVKGHKFSKDTEWQKQFEDEFPYEETPDQLTSLEEIKEDMESDKPMDRLLCGDVGYGKTEVAVRGAFKAVMEGKQVAFLVPTTILADQHYKNMKNRFSDFPVKIDMISRFRTAKEQKATIQAVKEGNVDILIGTHRMVSKDIVFKDLGLLIIDEEQRFGVAQKEKMKEIKKNVDVLTLSATPIPRTLHMSLTGVRDISVIETPPEERYPIQTYVVEQNDQLIRDAILREMNRDGQIFFVYNRVDDIQSIGDYLTKLVPECRIAIVHGQMTERQLETEMIAFMNREYDVLLCTTIIETGIDLPNVNTMIVYNADKMGLSQLYQLRGRVGRSNKIAYAYFVYKKDKILTEVAEKRLKALKDFTELGSGFKIAMRDLEIRGAGNMMGSAQHGHMSAIGYDLYCRMLEDTIRLVKGEIDSEPIETSIELKIDAYIPSEFIEDEIQKITIYKKIAAIENSQDYLEIKEELEDRFSDIPQPVFNLMDIAYIKSKANMLGIEEVKEKQDEVLFRFYDDSKVDKNSILMLMNKYKHQVYLSIENKSVLVYRAKEIKREDILVVFKEMLDYALEIRNNV